ncbi:MAG: hypothetical protein AUJ49_02340 [Desulfovibrionaceae bacterium CG1_02_65_16]|nr:MAG: hypothetical protein AUJ49_02340 [Desulfovibrionaceae bacterium CG1_02_65_16]
MSKRRDDILQIFAAVALAFLLVGLVSCGKRDWPAPKVSEDRYRIRTVNVTRAQNCVVVDMELAGAWQNLDSVRLLLEPIGTGPDDGCAECPFQPRIVRFYGLGAPEVRRDMNRLIITACDIDPKKTYRVQVVGNNIYPTLSLVISPITIVAPQ